MKRLAFLICPLLAAAVATGEPPPSPSEKEAAPLPQKVAKQPPDARITALQLPKVNFREADFSGALEYFRQKAEQQSNGALKLVFVQDLPKDFQPKHELSLDLTNIPFTVAFKYLAELAGVQFAIDGTTITVKAEATERPGSPPPPQDATSASKAFTGNNTHPPSERTIQPGQSNSARQPVAAPVSLPVLRAQLLSLLAESALAAESKDASPDERAAFHDAHRVKLRAILQTHGWPGRDLVGVDGSQAALNLLQEECTATELMKLALPLLQAAVQRQTATLPDLARLIDAERVGSSRMQLYATQYRAALDGQPVRFPVEDLPQVDARRRLVGLPTLRAQEEAMGLVAPLAAAATSRQTKTPILTRLQPSPGLNSVESPMLGWIYVHSRDDQRASGDGHAAGGGLETKALSTPKK